MTSAMNTTALTVVSTAPAIGERMAGERRAARHVASLLQALHVGDERVEVGRRQLAVLLRHRRLLRRLAPSSALRSGSTIHALMSSADELLRRRRRAGSSCRPCRRWNGRSSTSGRRTPPPPSSPCAASWAAATHGGLPARAISAPSGRIALVMSVMRMQSSMCRTSRQESTRSSECRTPPSGPCRADRRSP